MVGADQFMMRLHLQKVPQPPLGRGGPCEASPLYSCCPPWQKFRYLYLCLYLYQNLRQNPNLHICWGLHLTLLDIQCFFFLVKLPHVYRDIHLFGSTVNQQCLFAASGTRRKLRHRKEHTRPRRIVLEPHATTDMCLLQCGCLADEEERKE